ncbi:MAG: hypothetical protein PVSMB5_05810 [Ktedonobacteraceae bacterium]
MQANGSVGGADKETALCGRHWCKRPMESVAHALSWVSGIVGSKNDEGANGQHWRWGIAFW